MSSGVQRFLFEGLDIRGALVRLEDSWQHMLAGRNYPAPVAQLLGEMTAVTALIAGQLKSPGRLSFQLRGPGAVKFLLVDCDESLNIRGMARAEPVVLPAPAATLLGAHAGGQLALILDYPEAKEPYQSIVPLEGNSVAEIFESYLMQSEQLASRLFLVANEQAAACLFIQKMPDADKRDPDGWSRISQLASTVKPEELLQGDNLTLLTRLFHEDADQTGLRLYEPRPVSYSCPEDWEKIRGMLLGIGRKEVDLILAEHGEVLIQDEICNRDYRFSAEDIDILFASPTVH